ncbi:hypothetical protein QMK17_26280 [Rhodococcus sp. G-MC3]|uniref:hypothetical protein n=1 Tax=Rhodococcus sp. G-MC3 TaxID=3046209 RepID=UPI0024BBE7CA|nr:hypothetical protein [Rhodococcus sp. G-MC3]MDJ0396797.1 hypothetical protein [Rhodococcus sp. G-MC3]
MALSNPPNTKNILHRPSSFTWSLDSTNSKGVTSSKYPTDEPAGLLAETQIGGVRVGAFT